MMRKTLFLGVIVVLVIMTLVLAQRGQAQEEDEIPGWLKRTSYGISIESDQEPRVYIETVQPLYQDFDRINTVFTHGRITLQNERGTYSLGLGYRRLLNEELLGGINTFFDYQDINQHYRTGLGLEAIGKRLEGRFNTYFGLSPTRTIWETAAQASYEKVVDGYDIELGGPIPYLPWLKLYGSYYEYDFKKFSDMKGWKIRGEVKPFECLTINLETYDDNKGSQAYRIDTRFTLAFDSFALGDIIPAFKPSEDPFPEVDLRERTLDRVERNFNIQVEKWTVGAAATIEIKRGN
jgi:hypothetical protein